MTYTLYVPLEIPETEIATVIDWVKAEQVRIIQQDRTLGRNKIQKLDWLSETAENLLTLLGSAVVDRNEINDSNAWKQRQIDREAREALCTCRPGCSCNTEQVPF